MVPAPMFAPSPTTPSPRYARWLAFAPRLEPRLLRLDEVADVRLLADVGSGPQPREGPHPRARAHDAALQVAEGADARARLDHDAGRRTPHWARSPPAGHLGVEGQVHRVRRDQIDPGLHQRGPRAALEGGLGDGELSAGVDAFMASSAVQATDLVANPSAAVIATASVR